MFFTQPLKERIAQLEDELFSVSQVKDTLDNRMFTLELDKEGCITFANTQVLAELGYTEAQLIGKPLLDLVPSTAKQAKHSLQFKRAILDKSAWVGAVQLLNAQDQHVWLRAFFHPTLNKQQGFEKFDLHASVLTRTIETSRENKDLVKAINRSMAVIEFDLEGHILKANDQFLAGVGYAKEEIIGKHHRMFCEPEEANSTGYAEFWQKLQKGQFISSRFKRVNKFGEPIWLEATYNPVFNEQDVLYKVVKFATVITEQVNLEMAVSQAADIAYGTSTETDKAAKQGATVLDEMVHVMDDLAKQMEQAAAEMAELDKQSQQIAAIVQSISSIAEQT
ncbi:PAS domain-containing protein, partial [Pseudoalteromonas sp.]|uniref:PAS domain-containing protein n=1 Tax=Pseudoalteromonas sp. TaxID=53249 RepID=UPI00351731E9